MCGEIIQVGALCTMVNSGKFNPAMLWSVMRYLVPKKNGLLRPLSAGYCPPCFAQCRPRAETLPAFAVCLLVHHQSNWISAGEDTNLTASLVFIGTLPESNPALGWGGS